MYGGRIIVGTVISRLWNKHIPKTYKRYPDLVMYVSLLESFIYTTAVIINQEGFIVVWLTLKLAGQWLSTKTKLDRPLYHLFLLGNGLSIVMSAGIGFFMKILFQF